MPTQKRGFFDCDYCGLQCDTIEEAKEHELHCPKRPPQQLQHSGGTPHHQQLPPAYYNQSSMGPSPYAAGGPPPHEMEPSPYSRGPHPGMEPHYGGQPTTSPRASMRCCPLLPPGPIDRYNIHPDDAIGCQNIELFEASPEHIAEYDSRRSGGPPVILRQVGLRCVHCSKDRPTAANTIFPGTLGSFSATVRSITDHHLGSCGRAPPEVRQACQQVSRRRQTQPEMEKAAQLATEEEHSMMALLEHCLGLCHHLGIGNKQPAKTGVMYEDAMMSFTGPDGGPIAHTPATSRRAPHFPYSSDRMGPPMYPTPHAPSSAPHMGRGGMVTGPGNPVDGGITATPLQRNRDRPAEQLSTPYFSTERQGAPPYTQSDPGSEARYGTETPGMHSPSHPESTAGYPPHYGMPMNFPFYQDTEYSWQCRFCSHVRRDRRDPGSVWEHPNPPPAGFIDHHLDYCSQFNSPRNYQPGYGPQYGASPNAPPYNTSPSQWESHNSPAGAGPSYGGHSDQYGYPPHHSADHGPPGFGDPYASTRSPQGQSHVAVGSGNRIVSAPPRNRLENMGETMRRAISHLVGQENESYLRNPEIANIPRLVLDEDKLLLTDYFFFLMKQLRLCRFSEGDRKTRGGKRDKILIGYGGLQCIHCSDVPNPRKFYWSNVDRLANSFAEIPGHVLKCRRCPQQTKESLLALKQFHSEQMARLPRGSQKVFFRRMWRRLHDGDPKPSAEGPNDENKAPLNTIDAAISPPKATASSANTEEEEVSPSKSDESPLTVQRSTAEAAKTLMDSENQPPSPSSRVLLAIPEDKEWLSDMDCFIRKQIEVFCAVEQDVELAAADRKFPIHIGQVGIRCIHCSTALNGPSPSGPAAAFPFSVGAIYEAVREFQRLHLENCPNLPPSVKGRLADLKGSASLSSVLRKFYVLAARALGLEDTRQGLRASGKSVPLGSQAAFSFAEGGSAGAMAEEMRRAANFTSETVAAASPKKEGKPMIPATDDSGKEKKRPRSTSPEDESGSHGSEERSKLLKPSPESKVKTSPDKEAAKSDGETEAVEAPDTLPIEEAAKTPIASMADESAVVEQEEKKPPPLTETAINAQLEPGPQKVPEKQETTSQTEDLPPTTSEDLKSLETTATVP